MYVIDASVLAADARPHDPHHAEACVLLERVKDAGWAVYLPEIALAVVAAAISRGTADPTLAQRLAAALRRVPHFRFVPADAALGDEAADIAAWHRIRGCDAEYVALAWQQGFILITLDQQQRERVHSDLTARTPSEVLVAWGS
jgi:predicted nucleic acid-binding protein